MPEISEEEYVRLTRLGQFANSMMQNPESAKLLEKAAKIVDPNARTPRLDQEQAFAAPFAAVTESIEKLNKRLDDEAAKRENEALIAKANESRQQGLRTLRARGYNDAGIAAIEGLMAEKGIIDPLDAEAVFLARHPQPSVGKPNGTGINMPEMIHAGAEADKHVDRMLKAGNKQRELDVVGDQFAMDVLKDLRASSSQF